MISLTFFLFQLYFRIWLKDFVTILWRLSLSRICQKIKMKFNYIPRFLVLGSFYCFEFHLHSVETWSQFSVMNSRFSILKMLCGCGRCDSRLFFYEHCRVIFSCFQIGNLLFHYETSSKQNCKVLISSYCLFCFNTVEPKVYCRGAVINCRKGWCSAG